MLMIIPKYVDVRKPHFNVLMFIIINQYVISHLPLVPHICISESGQHWFRLWLVAYSVPSHYLNQCWIIVNWTLRDTIRWNFSQKSNFFIRENVLENVICEVAAILSRRVSEWLNLTAFLGTVDSEAHIVHISRCQRCRGQLVPWSAWAKSI